MSESEENVEVFQRLLKEKCGKKPIKLYENKSIDSPKFAPHYVLQHVSTQIKTIQIADSVKSDKCVKKCAFKQSSFLNVNMLPIYEEVHKATKFETQCVSDTQLINLVQNVEENIINTDMVHDFNTSFETVHSNNDNKAKTSDYIKIVHESESQSRVNEDIVPEMINDDNITSISDYSEAKHSPLSDLDGSNTLELPKEASNINQDVDGEENKLQIVTTCTRQKDNNSCTNVMKGTTKRDQMQLNAKCMRNVVFMSIELKNNENIGEDNTKIENNATGKGYGSTEFNHLERKDGIEDEVDIPLSLILNNTKEYRKSSLKDNNENYCRIYEKNLRGNKENEELSISKEFFTEDYDRYNQEMGSGPPGTIFHDNVLREKNLSVDTRKIVFNSVNDTVNRYKKDNLSVTKELFTEDFNVDGVLESRYTVPYMLKEVDSQELNDITLEPNKTLYNDMDLEFNNLENSERNRNISTEKEIEGIFYNDIKSTDPYIKYSLINLSPKTDLKSQVSEESTLKPNMADISFEINQSIAEGINIEEDITMNKNTPKIDTQITQLDTIKEEKFKYVHTDGITSKYQASVVAHDCIKDLSIYENKQEDRNKLEIEDEKVLSLANDSKVASSNFIEEIRSTSPIFNIKSTKRKSNTSSPLVFDLECFEKFESMAFTLMGSTDALKIAKQLIDSQIINNECQYVDQYVYEKNEINPEHGTNETTIKKMCNEDKSSDERAVKPQWDVTKLNDGLFSVKAECTPIFNSKIGNNTSKDKSSLGMKAVYQQINSNISKDKVSQKTVHDCTPNAESKVKYPKIAEDEILFSSDEESEYIHKDIQELPFTCILEASYHHDTSEVLDKTMYVGFQTASNKSIQISTDTYIKAKSIMDINVDNKPLNALVDLFDGQSKIDVTNLESKLYQFDDIKNSEKLDIDNENDNGQEICKKVYIGNELSVKDDELEVKISNPNKTKPNAYGVSLYDDVKSTHSSNHCYVTRGVQQKRPLESFMTASNKRIKLSDVALARCQKIFSDIDVADDFRSKHSEIDIDIKNDYYPKTDIINKKVNENSRIYNNIDDCLGSNVILTTAEERQTHKHNNKKQERINEGPANTENLTHVNINDELIIQEFENIEMSLEEKESEVIVNSTPKEFSSPSDEAERVASNRLVDFENAGETEDLLQDINLTEIVHKFVEQEEPSNININNDTASETLKGPNNYLNKDGNQNVIVKENEITVGNKINSETHPKIPEDIQFDGFKTASNKHIKISTNALINSKRVFCDIDLNCQTELEFKPGGDDVHNNIKTTTIKEFIKSPDNIEIKNPLKGFHTASNKPINISEELLQKTKNIFSDFEIIKTNINDETEYIKSADRLSNNILNKCDKIMKSNNIISENYAQIFDRFQTSSKKPGNKSKKALKLTEQISKDINMINASNDTDKSDQYNDRQTFTGYRTANNKPVAVSKQALDHTAAIFKYVNFNNADFGCNDDEAKCLRITGFQTGHNKPIEISNQALVRAKDILKDLDFENLDNDAGQIKPIGESSSVTTSEFIGFQTANHKPVGILNQTTDSTKRIHLSDTGNQNQCGENITKFTGFKTANNKPVAISKQALKNVKDIFKDIDFEDVVDEINNEKPKDTYKRVLTPGFIGFQTGNSKPDTITKESLEQSKHLFKDMAPFAPLRNENEVCNGENKVESSVFKGFQTANNKPVHISEQALKSTKDLFKDIPVEDIENRFSGNNYSEIPKFKGFYTANNKPVKVSTEALIKSKSLFQDIDVNEDLFENFNTKNDNAQFKGFKTASNKKVAISKQALARCKNIFSDIDILDIGKGDQSKVQDNNGKTNNLEIPNDCDITENNAINAYYEVNEKRSDQNNLKGSTIINIDEIKSPHINTSVIHVESNTNSSRIKSSFSKDNKTIHRNINEVKYINSGELKAPKDVLLADNTNDGKRYEKIDQKVNHEYHINELLNTQLADNFEITLHTEDFHKTPPKVSRRSGSPILSCPKAKKRKKFEVPYSATPMKKKINIPTNLNVENKEIYKFDENYKKNKLYCLKDLINIEAEFRLNNNESNSINTVNNLEDIELKTFIFTKETSDINKESITVEELRTIFVNSVDKKIMPDEWFDNHFKMIVWKLLGYENKFTNCMRNVCRVTNVLEQLKYRYDVELYNARRPALRRILEKDDIPSKFMVLCVAGIYVDGILTTSVTKPSSNIELLLTDGWYAVKASIDKMLATLVSSKKISVGTKLATCGAELANCEQGVSPWEDTSSVRLKLHGNCTRRARWDTRLGYHGNAAILSSLGAVKVDGGKVPRLRVHVTRVYPALYVEKFEDGSTETRSERLEHMHQMKHESERAAILEKIYEEVERQIFDQESQDSDVIVEKGAPMETGTQIAKCMKKCMDPAEFHNHLTSTQHKLLEEHTNKRREKLVEDIQRRVREKIESRGVCVNRNVVQLLKIRVLGIERDGTEVAKGVLSIWKPSDAILDLLEEGACVDVMNVMPTAMRKTEIQLSAGRQSIFKKHTPKNGGHTRVLDIYKRQSVKIGDIIFQPRIEYNEIDTVGIIIDIEPDMKEFDVKKHSFQNVYLSDERKNVASVIFWGGIRMHGYGSLFEIGQTVCCVNLQKRLGNPRVLSFRVTEFSYFTKTPKYKDLRLILDNLCSSMAGVDMKKFRAECLLVKNNVTSKSSCNVSISPLNHNSNAVRVNQRACNANSPLINKISDEYDVTGLDFESTFKQSEEQIISPKLLQRKREINMKIAKLKMYGEPPPLNPIYIINKSKNASNNFKSPLVSKNDVSDISVSDSDSSTICNEKSILDKESIKYNVGLDRTCLKLKPSRINFSNNDESNVSEVVDPFAEEFDGSLPLSLDSCK